MTSLILYTKWQNNLPLESEVAVRKVIHTETTQELTVGAAITKTTTVGTPLTQ